MMRILGFFLGFTGLLVGCDRTSSPAPVRAGGAKIQVLATVYPLADMARRVGGTAVDVQWLVEGREHPEELQASTELQQRANRAGLVLTSGPWDAWAVKMLSTEARAARVIEADRMPSARSADPAAYVWLDPVVVKEMAEALREKLTLLHGDRAAEFRANAAAYAAELDQMSREWETRERTVLAVRPVWGALGKRFGVNVVTPVEGVTEVKLSAGEFKTLAAYAKENGLGTILVDVGTPAAVRRQIEEKTGLRAVTMDAVGTSAPDGRSSLVKVLKYDLEQLRGAAEGKR